MRFIYTGEYVAQRRGPRDVVVNLKFRVLQLAKRLNLDVLQALAVRELMAFSRIDLLVVKKALEVQEKEKILKNLTISCQGWRISHCRQLGVAFRSPARCSLPCPARGNGPHPAFGGSGHHRTESQGLSDLLFVCFGDGSC